MAKINPKYKFRQFSIDIQLLIIVLILIVFGLIMVYDASAVQALKDFGISYYYIRQQFIWVIAGTILAFFFVNFDYHKLSRFALPSFLATFFLLLAVFIPGLGISAGGAPRWLNLGFATIQPGEIIKFTGVIYLATIFEKKVRLMPLIIIVFLITVIMAVFQKDLGSTAVFIATAAVIYFISRGPIVHFALAIPVIILSFVVLTLTSEYRSKRILAFLDPFSDVQGYTYHISQILIALGSGGIMGLGLGQSRQKFEYIPEVTTDSIFAIVGEELGFIGCLVLITLFVLLVLKGMKIARNAPDNFGKILAVGITSLITIQAIVNLSSMVALLPLTGVPLPFISYGGSALVVNMAAIGILLNISRKD